MKYYIHLIDSKGQGSYMTFKNKMSWKSKRIVVKHAKDIMSCKNRPWNTVLIEIENELGEVVRTIK